MTFEVGTTGNLVQGSIFDANRSTLERMVKAYDKQLYFKWNPKKNKGMGVWELRRSPELKRVVDTVKLGGASIVLIDHKETDLESHVKDLPYLGYDLLEWIKASDVWSKIDYDKSKQHRVSQFTDQVDDNYYKAKADASDKAKEEMLYNLKQDKQVLKSFQESIASGLDPAHLLRYWK